MEIKAKEIKIVDINSIIPNPKNNNQHSEKQIKQLCKIIKYQKFRNPLIVSNRSGFLVCGHGRLEAARQLGMVELPVIYQDFESEAEEYAHLTADNAIAAQATIDMDQVLEDVKEFDLDFDLLGFEDFELPEVELCEPQCDEDSVPEIQPDPITKRGDIWLLGNHRVMCGDSTMIDDVEKLTLNKRLDMVFTDPPYSQHFQGGGCFDTDSRQSMQQLKEENKKEKNLNNFNPEEFLNVLSALSVPTHYIFCNKNLLRNYIEYFESLNRNWNLLCMKKTNPIPHKNNTFLPDVEYLFCSREKGAYWDNSLDMEYYHRIRNISVSKSEFGHPTEKKVDYISPYMQISAEKGEVALDLFLGSGTTLIACEKTNRKCYGMELDEKYCDVIIRRWQKYTGKQAILESTGEVFNG